MTGLDTQIAVRPALAAPRLDIAGALTRRLASVLPLVAVVAGWEALARSHLLSAFLLPPISAVLARVWDDAASGELVINLGLTLYRALTGFVIAGVAGGALGIVMPRRPSARWFCDAI